MFEGIFSDRELETLHLMPHLRVSEIAARLGVTDAAVKMRQSHIAGKLGIRGYGQGCRLKIVVWALWVGLIE